VTDHDQTGVPPAPPPPGSPSVAERERYARLLLNADERGVLGDVEYVERCAAIDTATSIDELNQIVQELPILGSGRPAGQIPPAVRRPSSEVGGRGTVGGAGRAASASAATPGFAGHRESLDPVDLARLQQIQPAAKDSDHRWLALVVIVVLFVVLIIFGAVLLSRIHSTNSSGTSAPVASVAGIPATV